MSERSAMRTFRKSKSVISREDHHINTVIIKHINNYNSYKYGDKINFILPIGGN